MWILSLEAKIPCVCVFKRGLHILYLPVNLQLEAQKVKHHLLSLRITFVILTHTQTHTSRAVVWPQSCLYFTPEHDCYFAYKQHSHMVWNPKHTYVHRHKTTHMLWNVYRCVTAVLKHRSVRKLSRVRFYLIHKHHTGQYHTFWQSRNTS